MKRRGNEPPGAAIPAHPRRPPLLVLLPVALLFAVSGGVYLFHSRPDARRESGAPPHPDTLNRMRLSLDKRNEREAFASAKQFVRAHLLPPDAAGTVHFPDFAARQDLPQGARVGEIQVTRQRPSLYRVRGTVQWRGTGGVPGKVSLRPICVTAPLTPSGVWWTPNFYTRRNRIRPSRKSLDGGSLLA